MEEFKQSLMSVNWWLSAVIVAVLVNVFSTYLKNPLDRMISRLNQFRLNWNEELRASNEASLKRQVGDPNWRIRVWQIEVRHRFRAVFYLAGIIICYLLQIKGHNPRVEAALGLGKDWDEFITAWTGNLCLFMFCMELVAAYATSEILKEVQRSIEKSANDTET